MAVVTPVAPAPLVATTPPVAAQEGDSRPVKLQRDVDAVLGSYCLGCHAWSSTSVVRLASACGAKGSRLVVPRDLRRSPLYGKVAGAAVCGGPMPPTIPLPQAAVAALRTWILEGAPIDGKPSPAVNSACVSCGSGTDDALEVNALNRDD